MISNAKYSSSAALSLGDSSIAYDTSSQLLLDVKSAKKCTDVLEDSCLLILACEAQFGSPSSLLRMGQRLIHW